MEVAKKIIKTPGPPVPQILPPVPQKKSLFSGALEGLGSVGEAAGKIYRSKKATSENASAEDILRAPASESWKQLALQQRNARLGSQLGVEKFFESLPSGGKPLTAEQISTGHALDPKRMAAIVKARGPEQTAYLKREAENVKKADTYISSMQQREDDIDSLSSLRSIVNSPDFKGPASVGFRTALAKIPLIGPILEGATAGGMTQNQVFEKYVAKLMGPELRGLVQAGGARLFRPEIDTILKSLPSVHNSKKANLTLIDALIKTNEKANAISQIYADMLRNGEVTGEKDFSVKFLDRMKERFAEKEEPEISKPNGADFITLTDPMSGQSFQVPKKDAEKANLLLIR